MKKITLVVILFCVINLPALSLTDSELIAVRDAFQSRRNSMLSLQAANPYPCDPENPSAWCYMDNALANLYINQNLVQANEAVIDACDYFLANDLGQFFWGADLFLRIYELFNSDSVYFPGRLSSEAEAAMCNVFWQCAKTQSKVANAKISTWELHGSENRDAMELTGWWGAAKVLRKVSPYNTYLYDDGYTAEQHYQAWNNFLKVYFPERAKRGLMVEIASGYSPYTLQLWYNCFDFAEDAELKNLAKGALDLWWADWAQEQINSVRGGSKARLYQDNALLASADSCASMAWYYFGIGNAGSRHPNVMCLATSEYRIPLVVMDIALDVSGRGVYECSSRRLGLFPDGHYPDNDPTTFDYYIDPNGGILKYSYCTPNFIIGTSMLEKRPNNDWAGISSQNRWIGAIFAGHRDSRIVPQCEGLVNGKTYNQYWTVQNKGTLIVQKIEDGLSKQTGNMRVYFSDDLVAVKTESNDWVFINGPTSYAAVRPAWGGYTWDSNDNNWMLFNDELAPAIIDVVQSSDYANNFTSFKNDVLNNSLTIYPGDKIIYEGLRSSGTFTFYTKSNQLPEVDGVPINLKPSYTFKSPFINEDWGSGLVTITKNNRSLELDFRRPSSLWKLDEGSGTVAKDSVAFNDGNVYGSAVWSADGKIDGALYFDGTDDYIDFGNSGSLNGETDFSVMCWVKTDAATEQVLIQQRYASYQGEYVVKLKNTGKVNFFIYNGGYQFNFDSVKTVNDGQWHHVAVTRLGQTGTIYIDGIADASASGEVKSLVSELNVIVGFDKLGNDKYFKGYLDDIRIYTVCLKAADIEGLINAANTLLADIDADGCVNLTDFSVFADSWSVGSSDQVKFSVTSDNSGSTLYAHVLSQITTQAGGPGDFMISAGDMTPSSATRSMINTAFGTSFKWYPIVGRQEMRSSSDMAYLRDYYANNLSGNVNPGPANATETCYSFDAGPVHISVINVYFNGTSDVGTDGDVVAQLRNWLADDLAASDKPWKLVVGHEVAFKRPDDNYGDVINIVALDKYPTNRDLFWQLLQDNKVTAYICGQMHRYSLYQPYENGTYQLNVAESTGYSQYDCFVVVNADSNALTFDVYRSYGASSFSLAYSHTIENIALADINNDGSVDFQDLLKMSKEWLTCI